MIVVTKEFSFSEIGKRSNNEDNIGLVPGNLFIVCDGVGGAEKGEIASSIVVRSFESLYNHDPDNFNFSDALKQAENQISNYLSQNPSAEGMATTLVVAHKRQDGINVGWVGDSRLYQFRNKKIIYKTKDHSWINEALDAGILTPDEAFNHPKSNIITRAIQGSHNPVQLDETFISDLKVEDSFFLCSDGVLETWTDHELEILFGSHTTDPEILDTLRRECEIKSKDNNSGIFFHISDLSNFHSKSKLKSDLVDFDSPPIVEAIPITRSEAFAKYENQATQHKNLNYPPYAEESPKSSNLKALLYIFLFLFIAFFINKYLSEDDGKSPGRAGKNSVTEQSSEKSRIDQENDPKDNSEVTTPNVRPSVVSPKDSSTESPNDRKGSNPSNQNEVEKNESQESNSNSQSKNKKGKSNDPSKLKSS